MTPSAISPGSSKSWRRCARPRPAARGTWSRISRPSRPTRSKKPTKWPTRSRATILTISRTSSATCCCRWCSTPAWRRSGRVRLRRRGAGDHREAGSPASACVRRSSSRDPQAVKGLWEDIKAQEKRQQGARTAGASRRGGALAGVPVSVPRPHPRSEAAGESQQGRLRLERSACRVAQNSRRGRRDRGGARRRRAPAPRPKSAISCSPPSISPAIWTPTRRRCCGDQPKVRAPFRRDRERAGRAEERRRKTLRSPKWTRCGTKQKRENKC